MARVDPRDEPADAVAQGELRNEVEIVLATLSQREQAVIRLRFGLDDGRQRTLDEVGREFGLSRERIRQIEKVTLLKLRAPVAGPAPGGLRLLSAPVRGRPRRFAGAFRAVGVLDRGRVVPT